MKPKFIVIEGIDGSGKSTQAKLLIKRLKKQSQKVKSIHFPQHGRQVFGKLIDDYLANRFGPAPKLDYRLASVLYALDRFEAQKTISAWLKKGYWVILDRYAESNFGHQGGKIKSKTQRLKVMQWLYNLDYKILKNSKPDLVLFLDVPPKITIQLMKKMGKVLDGLEKDKIYLEKTYQTYKLAVTKFNYWQTIKCTASNQLLGKIEISDKIWQKIGNSE